MGVKREHPDAERYPHPNNHELNTWGDAYDAMDEAAALAEPAAVEEAVTDEGTAEYDGGANAAG